MAAWHTASGSREFGNLLTTGWVRSWCLGPRCRDASSELMRGFPTEWWSGPPDDRNHNVISAGEKNDVSTRPRVWDEAQVFFFLVVVFYFLPFSFSKIRISNWDPVLYSCINAPNKISACEAHVLLYFKKNYFIQMVQIRGAHSKIFFLEKNSFV